MALSAATTGAARCSRSPDTIDHFGRNIHWGCRAPRHIVRGQWCALLGDDSGAWRLLTTHPWIARSVRAALSLPVREVVEDSDALLALRTGMAEIGAIAIWALMAVVAAGATASVMRSLVLAPPGIRHRVLAIGGAAIALSSVGLFLHIARATWLIRLGARWLQRPSTRRGRTILLRLLMPTPWDYVPMVAGAILMAVAVERWRAFG
jgi:hypothetical protein